MDILGGATRAVSRAVARPVYSFLAQTQGQAARPPSPQAFRTPATRLGTSPAVRAAGAGARATLTNPVQFYVGPQAARAISARPFNPYAAGLETALALVPGAGTARGVSRFGAPALFDPRAQMMAAYLARFAPRFNNMRG